MNVGHAEGSDGRRQHHDDGFRTAAERRAPDQSILSEIETWVDGPSRRRWAQMIGSLTAVSSSGFGSARSARVNLARRFHAWIQVRGNNSSREQGLNSKSSSTRRAWPLPSQPGRAAAINGSNQKARTIKLFRLVHVLLRIAVLGCATQTTRDVVQFECGSRILRA
jgi:hypothetical protein